MPKLVKLVSIVFAAAGLAWRRGVLYAQAEIECRKHEEGLNPLTQPALNVLSGKSIDLVDMPTSRWIN